MECEEEARKRCMFDFPIQYKLLDERDLYVTNLALFNRHGMSLEQIAKSMDIVFLTLLDQLLQRGYFITALEMIDMT